MRIQPLTPSLPKVHVGEGDDLEVTIAVKRQLFLPGNRVGKRWLAIPCAQWRSIGRGSETAQDEDAQHGVSSF